MAVRKHLTAIFRWLPRVRRESSRSHGSPRENANSDASPRTPQDAGVSRTRLAVVGMTWTTIGMGFYSILQVPVLAVLARLIPPAEFGVANTVLIVFGFGANIFQGGVMLNIAQRKIISGRDAAFAFQVSLSLAGLLFLITVISAGLIESLFRAPGLHEAIIVISFAFLIRGCTAVSEALLFHEQRYKAAASVNFFPFALGYAPVAIGLAYMGFSFWAIVIGNISLQLVKLVQLVALAPHPIFVRPKISELHDHATQTLTFSVGRLATYFVDQGPSMVVGRVLGMEALGLYGRICQIMMIPDKVFTKVVTSVTTPLYASVQDDQARVARALRNSIRMVSIIMAPSTVFLVVFRSEIVFLLLGEAWIEAADVLAILGVASFFMVIYKVPLSVLHAQGLGKSTAISQTIYAAGTMAGTIMVADQGLEAVATAIAALGAANYFFVSYQAIWRVGMAPFVYVKAHSSGLAIGAGFLLVAVMLRHALAGQVHDVVAAGVAGVCLILAIMYPVYRFAK